ncbi:MAG: CpsD/CapB family tyrosine-protein kinase [Clostridia bacterium]|nr:CpsD/CapB family tyrosine-protein kinase [Clostridia bacterium]
MKVTRFESLAYQANEALNTLCTNLFFAGGDIKKVMLTSCHPQEGKSFVTMNLMRSLANLGMKVVLVDADIRASALQGVYGVQVKTQDGQPYSGLTSYLAGRCKADDIIGQTDIENACMILSGRNVINSLPLLNSNRLENLLNSLSEQFDVVLVDAPPVGTIIDAAKIARVCDGTLFVVESGGTSYHELRMAMQQIEKTGCPILGSVLNKFNERLYGDKYYYKKSYYASNDAALENAKHISKSDEKKSRNNGK